MDIPQPTFGKKLKRLRTLCKLTQEKVAELAGCSSRWYQTLEAGNGNPSPKLARRLMDVLAPEEGAVIT